MAKIERRDILGPRLYQGVRDELRRRIIVLKKDRRVALGDRVTLVFENRDTLLFQIEEMLRAESITQEQKIQEEIDVYNVLMPTDSELSATLFLEIPRNEDAKAALHRFIGIDEHVALLVGEHRVPARFEAGRQQADRISAVQYTRFPLTLAQRSALCTRGVQVTLQVAHPNYQHQTPLGEEMRASLARDLDPGDAG